jgi:hypothetical protein
LPYCQIAPAWLPLRAAIAAVMTLWFALVIVGYCYCHIAGCWLFVVVIANVAGYR